MLQRALLDCGVLRPSGQPNYTQSERMILLLAFGNLQLPPLYALVALPLLQALGFASCLQACKANGHALLAKSSEKRGGREKREL